MLDLGAGAQHLLVLVKKTLLLPQTLRMEELLALIQMGTKLLALKDLVLPSVGLAHALQEVPT